MPIRIDRLDDPRLAAYFTDFTSTAWGLRTLPYYRFPAEQEPFARFRAGHRSTVFLQPWIDTVVAPAVASGRDIGRVHVIERTTAGDGTLDLSDYLRFTLGTYTILKAAGEQIRIAWARPGAWPTGIWRPGRDCWLFDADTDHSSLMQLRYAPDGSFHEAVVTDHPRRIASAVQCQQAALQRSRPFYP